MSQSRLQFRSNSDSIATTVEHGQRQGEGRTGGARGVEKTGSTGRGFRVEKGGGNKISPKEQNQKRKNRKKEKRKALKKVEKKGVRGKEEVRYEQVWY